jgi:hypothetical protein
MDGKGAGRPSNAAPPTADPIIYGAAARKEFKPMKIAMGRRARQGTF